MTTIRDDRIALFAKLQDPASQPQFWDRVADDVDSDTTIAELHSTSTTNEGADFANDYCWVCRFDGDIIVEVRAHVDSMMVAYTILRNEA